VQEQSRTSESQTPGGEGEQRVTLSRGFFVVMRGAAVGLPATITEPAITLDPTMLRVLEHLSSSAPATRSQIAAEIADCPADEVEAFLELLVERRLLVAPGLEPSPPAATPIALDELRLDPDAVIVLPSPVALRLRPGGFEWHDHEGRLRLRASVRELCALAASVTRPAAMDEAFERHVAVLGSVALDRDDFDRTVERAVAAGIAYLYDSSDPAHTSIDRLAGEYHEGVRRALRTRGAFRQVQNRHDREMAARPEGLRPTVPVMGVNGMWSTPPLALGMLIAHARAHDGGVLEATYDFSPVLLTNEEQLRQFAASRPPGVYLFSDYAWTVDQNLRLSQAVKEVSPHSVTVHGGPEMPKYPGDGEAFLERHPHVDVSVIGEGEVTLTELLVALAPSMAAGTADLSLLGDVPGLLYSHGGRVVRSGPRDRVADLDALPSPILAGMFDPFKAASPSSLLILETNRGCPYGCTFCDWGASTMSRIRKFDLDRVFEELRWAAEHKIGTLFIADANFGIFERDVDIAQHIADLKAEFGFPLYASSNFAKNTVKYLRPIIGIFSAAGILTEGKVSLQTMDEPTLLTIRRKNIKVEKYEDLATEFHRAGLSLSVEMMMGLPGSTATSFRNDLQSCIDRDVRGFVYPTVMLPNSPMNDPQYREENGLVAKPGEYVCETATYTRAEWDAMYQLRAVFQLCDLFGVLRQVATFVRSELGIGEVEFYERIGAAALDDRERFPTLAFTLNSGSHTMVPPSSWALMLDDVERYLTEDLGLPADDALATALEVQRALLPARERTFPLRLQLPHDYGAWHRAVNEERLGRDRQGWHEIVPRLGTYPPAEFPVDDPMGVCQFTNNIVANEQLHGGWWEFDSPASRPRPTGQDDELDLGAIAVDAVPADTKSPPDALGVSVLS